MKQSIGPVEWSEFGSFCEYKSLATTSNPSLGAATVPLRKTAQFTECGNIHRH